MLFKLRKIFEAEMTEEMVEDLVETPEEAAVEVTAAEAEVIPQEAAPDLQIVVINVDPKIPKVLLTPNIPKNVKEIPNPQKPVQETATEKEDPQKAQETPRREDTIVTAQVQQKSHHKIMLPHRRTKVNLTNYFYL